LIWLPRVAASVSSDQRPLDLAQHAVIAGRGRQPVLMRVDEGAQVALDRAGQRLVARPAAAAAGAGAPGAASASSPR
jgi:hypothetical protein